MPDSAPSSHPGTAQLAAFAQDKLAAGERSALKAHLKACPDCRQALRELPAAGESVIGSETLATMGAPRAESASGHDTRATMGAPRGDAVRGRDTLAAMGTPRPGATATHHPGSEVPADLANHPRYEVLAMLGQGGMGAVYKARHKKMDRFVALKVINTQLLDNPKAVERFQREVQAAAKLDHPNIVRAHDADEAGGTHFLVMEFVEGTDLAKYVDKKGPLPVVHACHFIRQAALGLEHAHQHGMVHRDIKPHNLMLTQAAPGGPAAGVPVVKVMDFGLALVARETASAAGLTGENALMGTADYIAPEQAEDAHKADIRADIYSLGCSLFHLLLGRPPLEGANVPQKLAAHLTGNLPFADLPAGVPAELRTVLAKMVAKAPADRHQTPAEVAQALTSFVKTATGAKPPAVPTSIALADTQDERTIPKGPTKPKRVRKRKRERRSPLPVWISVGAVAAVVLIASIVLLANRGRHPKQGPVEAAPFVPEEDPKPPAALQPTYTNTVGMGFVLVPKGASWLEGGGGAPGKKREIAYDFYLGKYEVTQAEWAKVLGSQPSYFRRAGEGQGMVKDITDEELRQFPVESVSWNDAQAFLTELNKRDKDPGWTYRLPKEKEWEYACRGGPMSDRLDSTFDFYFEQPAQQLQPNQANFEDQATSLKRTCKVGSYKPNKLGLYDMHGNVCELCDDVSIRGPAYRVVRGGAWFYVADVCRAGYRVGGVLAKGANNIGLRVARVPVGSGGQ